MTTIALTNYYRARTNRAGIDPNLLADYAMLDGNDLVLTLRGVGFQATRTVRFLGAEQPAVFQRRMARKAALPFVAADFLADAMSATSMTEHVPLVTGGPSHVACWQPATELALTNVRLATPATNAGAIDAHQNLLRFMDGPTPLTVDGEAGFMWSTKDGVQTRLAFAIGGTWIMSQQGAEYPPYGRLIGWSDDETIDASDLGAGVVHYLDRMPLPTYGGSADRAYVWVATPKAHAGYPDEVAYGGIPQTNAFMPSPDVTHNSVVYEIVRGRNLSRVPLSGERTIELRYR